VDELQHALNDPDPPVRATVIRALAREWIRDMGMLAPLEQALDHELADVRRAAAEAIESLPGVNHGGGGGDALVRRFGVETDGGVREALFAAILKKAGDPREVIDLTPVRSELLDDLNHPDPARRTDVARAIRRRFTDAEAAGAMMDRLRIEAVPAVRIQIAMTYPPNAGMSLPVLASLLVSDADPLIRSRLAWGLGELGPSAVPALLAALDDADHRVRAAAATSLGKVGDASVIPQLTAVLQDPDPGYDVPRASGTPREEVARAVRALAARCRPQARRPGRRYGRGKPK
jgi:HEAT repeat protein